MAFLTTVLTTHTRNHAACVTGVAARDTSQRSMSRWWPRPTVLADGYVVISAAQ
jgi:hypothetical protein